MIIIQAISKHLFQWDSPFISSNHGTSMVLPWLDTGWMTELPTDPVNDELLGGEEI